jgi:hypothetical protein
MAPVVVHAMRAREKFLRWTPCPAPSKTSSTTPTSWPARFEDYQPDPDDERDPQAFTALRDAVLRRSDAERTIRAAVDDARRHGYSWTHIGTLLGTTGEAARQRYAPKQ